MEFGSRGRGVLEGIASDPSLPLAWTWASLTQIL